MEKKDLAKEYPEVVSEIRKAMMEAHVPSPYWSKDSKPLFDAGTRKASTAEFIPGMRMPAELSENGRSVSAVIPESIEGYTFMLVDENGFMQYSKVASAE